MHLLIDDIRDLPVDVTVRSVRELEKWIDYSEVQQIDVLWLDFHLGADKPDGLDVLFTLMGQDLLPKTVVILTRDGLEVSILAKCLSKYGYIQVRGDTYRLEEGSPKWPLPKKDSQSKLR